MQFIKLIKSKIVKKDNKYQVQSEKGKNLGTYDSKEEAEKRLKQVEYFKHKESAKTKKTSPKVKKIVKKPTKKVKTTPKRVLTKSPNKTIEPTKKHYKSQNKPVSRKYKIKTKTSIYPLQDVSLPVFEDLLEQGYNMITFVAHPNACKFCQKINGKTKNLYQHLQSLQYAAPVFEFAHVNALSKLKVWDKNGELEPVYVNYNGDMSY